MLGVREPLLIVLGESGVLFLIWITRVGGELLGRQRREGEACKKQRVARERMTHCSKTGATDDHGNAPNKVWSDGVWSKANRVGRMQRRGTETAVSVPRTSYSLLRRSVRTNPATTFSRVARVYPRRRR